jgi:C1A family cysteine protease
MALMTRKGHWLGGLPSKPNPNELGFPSHLIVRSGEFPVRAFVKGPLGPVKNQGNQGSCTGHGSTSEGERLYRKGGRYPIFSPAFHYYIEREIEGTLAQGDCGAQVDTSLVVAENGGHGFCPEENMPYSDADYSTPPSVAALTAALKYPGGSHHSIGNVIANIKSCILSDYTGVIGFSVYSSFDDDKTAETGVIPYPNLEVEQLEGGHEEHGFIGYDDTIQCPNSPHPGAVLFQNSWGTGWGIAPPEPTLSTQRGFNWLSYDYLMNPRLVSDLRIQHLGGPWK